MAATPYSTAAFALNSADATFSTNAAAATDTGTLTWSIANAAGNTFLCYSHAYSFTPAIAVSSGQAYIFALGVSCPTGPSVQLGLQVQVLDASNNAIAVYDSPTITVGAAIGTAYVNTGTFPAGATSVRLLVMLREGPGASRTLKVATLSARYLAQADDVLSVSLERDLARSADTNGAGGLVITQGPIGPRAGQIVYLCSSWDVVTQLDTLYRNGSVTLDTSPYIPSWTHYATDKLRAATEKALPGTPARWLVTVPIREAS